MDKDLVVIGARGKDPEGRMVAVEDPHIIHIADKGHADGPSG